MKKILGLMVLAVLAISSLVVGPFGGSVLAANEFDKKACSEISDPQLKAAAGCDEKRNVGSVAQSLINVAIGVIAVAAVVIIILSVQRFMTASGDPGQIERAKNMLIWSVVALVVSILAWAIVNFVTGVISSGQNTGTESGTGGEGETTQQEEKKS